MSQAKVRSRWPLLTLGWAIASQPQRIPECPNYRYTCRSVRRTHRQLVLRQEPDSVTVLIPANGTPTFSVFASAMGNVPFDPANNRIFVRFSDSGGVTRGATSVAVRATQ